MNASKHAYPVELLHEGLFGATAAAPAIDRAAAMVAAYYGTTVDDARAAMRPWIDQCDEGLIPPREALGSFLAAAVENPLGL